MVIDTSALLAILLGEPERGKFLQLLSESETRLSRWMRSSFPLRALRGENSGKAVIPRV